MGRTCFEPRPAGGCGAVVDECGAGQGASPKLSPQRTRLLRRAALGIAGTGWALFGGSGLSDAAVPQDSAGGTLALDSILQDNSLRIGSLGLISSAAVPLNLILSPELHSITAFHSTLAMSAPANDSAAGQFALDVRERLPRFKTSFEQAGQVNGLDWRLIAAMSYQESSWDPKAVSPTGVRGIMMLTLDTADELEVDRDDPAESIQGAAEYLGQILDRLPPQIREPDRTNMALAAYNQGLGHLFDARRLAAQTGGNPNRWQDVRAALTLLTDEHWFSQTLHGYARGQEAVSFVNRVRSYYGMLASVRTELEPPAPMLVTTGM